MIDFAKISPENPVIAWWSGGADSAVACYLALQWFGVENVLIVFIDTMNEHDNNNGQHLRLRWYQHFYQGCGTKFHTAIKQYGISDWTFEVIEVLEKTREGLKEIMTQREGFWIKHFDSISNGYNSMSVISGQ